jgi:peptide/nickel transport system substrate-binding protein
VQLAQDIKLALAFFNDSFEPQSLPGPAYIQADQLFDGLTQRSVDGALQPALATSWTAVGPTTWEFKLRPNVKFHDGSTLAASDVKFSVERLLNPAEQVPAITQFGTIDRVEAPDPLTVRVITKGPDPLLPARMILAKVIPERAWNAAGGKGGFGRAPVGTGPFKFSAFEAGTTIVYEAFRESWRAQPAMGQARLIRIPEEATMVASLRTGEIDMANDFSIDSERAVRDTGTVDVVPTTRTATHTFDLNFLQHEELRDVRVRYAINHAVDKEAVNRAATGGYSVIADGQLVPRGVFGYNPNLRPFEYDVNRARTLMREAGREAGFTGTMTTLAGVNTLIAQAVSGYLQAINIRTEVQTVETAVYLQRFNEGRKGMFFLSPFNFGTLLDSDQVLNNFRGSAAPALRRLESPRFDAAFDASKVELDPARREQLLREAAAVLREEAPSLYLFQQGYLIGVNKKVQGFQPRLDNSIRFDTLTRER